MILIYLFFLLIFLTNPIPAQAWYSTFEYNGQTYAWSEAYKEDYWTTIVKSDQGSGWCNGTLVTGGRDNNYNDWFLPSLDQALKGINSYSGANPLSMSPPADCHGYQNMSLRALWTSTECGGGSRAYFVHKSTVIDDNIPQYINCNNEADWCCFRKSNYGIVHTCPLGRCIRLVGGNGPTPTVNPSVTPTRRPTNTPAGSCLVGDADCNRQVSYLDFSAWRSAQYDGASANTGDCSGTGSNIYGDSDCSGEVAYLDFSEWRSSQYD